MKTKEIIEYVLREDNRESLKSHYRFITQHRDERASYSIMLIDAVNNFLLSRANHISITEQEINQFIVDKESNIIIITEYLISENFK